METMSTGGWILSDEILATFVPILAYWIFSGICVLLGNLENYRLHSKNEEDEKNLVSKIDVVKVVLLQQAVQAFVATTLFDVTGSNKKTSPQANQRHSLIVLARQFLVAMIVFDTCHYFMHRLMHQNKFLYRHIHSHHHRLIVPYAYGAEYNHPVEGFLLNTIGGALSYFISGMSPRTSIFFFTFASLKAVNDHSGVWLRCNPFDLFFSNNSAYHDIHHSRYGYKYNFSQPFFVTWDKILGTYMPFSVEKRTDGGFEARPTKYIRTKK